VEFEWDEHKAATNLAKHKVAFEDAIAIFDDKDGVRSDAKTVDGERRHKRTGIAGAATLLTIIYATREVDGEDVLRIISVRPASRKERRTYGDRSIPTETTDE